MLTGEDARIFLAARASARALLYLELVFELDMRLSDKMFLRQYSHEILGNAPNSTPDNLLGRGYDFSKNHDREDLQYSGNDLGIELCQYYLARTYPQIISTEEDYAKLIPGLSACVRGIINKSFREADAFWSNEQ